MSFEQIGVTVSWLEAVFLVAILIRDTSSWLGSANAKWKFPASREWIVAAHQYDLTARVNSKKKPKPYPTPWENADTQKLGSQKPQDRSRVLGVLERMNPKES